MSGLQIYGLFREMLGFLIVIVYLINKLKALPLPGSIIEAVFCCFLIAVAVSMFIYIFWKVLEISRTNQVSPEDKKVRLKLLFNAPAMRLGLGLVYLPYLLLNFRTKLQGPLHRGEIPDVVGYLLLIGLGLYFVFSPFCMRKSEGKGISKKQRVELEKQ